MVQMFDWTGGSCGCPKSSSQAGCAGCAGCRSGGLSSGRGELSVPDIWKVTALLTLWIAWDRQLTEAGVWVQASLFLGGLRKLSCSPFPGIQSRSVVSRRLTDLASHSEMRPHEECLPKGDVLQTSDRQLQVLPASLGSYLLQRVAGRPRPLPRTFRPRLNDPEVLLSLSLLSHSPLSLSLFHFFVSSLPASLFPFSASLSSLCPSLYVCACACAFSLSPHFCPPSHGNFPGSSP